MLVYQLRDNGMNETKLVPHQVNGCDEVLQVRCVHLRVHCTTHITFKL